MSWIGRFGKRPHSILTSDDLFKLVDIAKSLGRHCAICGGEVAGIVHCKDCGWTLRLCDFHRPKNPEVKHWEKLHAAICEPVAGSN